MNQKNLDKGHNDKQVSDDAFYMAIISLIGREPDHWISSQTDRDDFKITAIYEPKDNLRLPFFSDFEIVSKSDAEFRIPLKKYKERYMEFRSLILDKVQKEKQRQR